MPIYEYLCEDCGPFTAMRKMADYLEPCDCPDCGTSAPRVVLTAPRAALMSSTSRSAFEANERSRHEPRRSSAHGAGCACCSGASKASTGGAKSFPSARPWMISH
ncbi:hypothetical+protein [Methylocapsa aurea]|uniref:FmdB family zinc ribbon protein n=1 Tax=Methylocapsa aurea TaxID=663610 RepID=UPI003D18E7D9